MPFATIQMVLQKNTTVIMMGTLMLVAAATAAVATSTSTTSMMTDFVIGTAHAQGAGGMSITATAQDGSDVITVTGKTASMQKAVTVQVRSPNDNIVFTDQITPGEDGTFDTRIVIGTLWKQDGTYTINVQQGTASLYDLSLRVKIGGGTAFGTDVTESTLVDASDARQQPDAAPRIRGLTIEADAVEGDDTFTINGQTSRTQVPITLRVTAPNGNIASVNQITPNADGSFSREIVIGGNLWSDDGFYTVTARQGEGSNYRQSVQIEIKDGLVIPEFGAIAALVLAVAIVAVIAVSARSRLSIVMPRY